VSDKKSWTVIFVAELIAYVFRRVYLSDTKCMGG